MEFHLIQAGAVGRRRELEQGMAGQRGDLYQRYLEEVRARRNVRGPTRRHRLTARRAAGGPDRAADSDGAGE